MKYIQVSPDGSCVIKKVQTCNVQLERNYNERYDYASSA